MPANGVARVEFRLSPKVIPVPGVSVKSRREVTGARDEFLRNNRWDESSGRWVALKAAPRDMGTMSREQVRIETAEIHLATGFQTMLYDLMPDALRAEIYDWLRENAKDERKPADTDEQFFYKTRKKALGPFNEYPARGEVP